MLTNLQSFSSSGGFYFSSFEYHVHALVGYSLCVIWNNFWYSTDHHVSISDSLHLESVEYH